MPAKGRQTVLITGSSGLIGGGLLRWLEPRYRVVGFGRSGERSATYWRGDLRSAEDVWSAVSETAPDVIVHSGAISHPGLYVDRPDEIHAVNVQGTANVLEAARRVGVQRLVYLSSTAVYGSRLPTDTVSEVERLRPTNIYGATKAAAEMLVRGYGCVYPFETVCLRLVSVYGPARRTFTVPNFLISCAVDGVPVRLRFGNQQTDFIYIDDACRAIELALSAAPAGETYTIATGAPVTFRDIAAIVRGLVPDCQVMVEDGVDPAWQEPVYDVSRAAMDLGFRTSTSIAEGLAYLLTAMRADDGLRRSAREGPGNAEVAVPVEHA